MHRRGETPSLEVRRGGACRQSDRARPMSFCAAMTRSPDISPSFSCL